MSTETATILTGEKEIETLADYAKALGFSVEKDIDYKDMGFGTQAQCLTLSVKSSPTFFKTERESDGMNKALVG